MSKRDKQRPFSQDSQEDFEDLNAHYDESEEQFEDEFDASEESEADGEAPSSGLSKEVKIGLGVIGGLLVLLVVVVGFKLRGSGDEAPPVAENKAPAEPATDGKSAPASGFAGASKHTTEVAAQSGAERKRSDLLAGMDQANAASKRSLTNEDFSTSPPRGSFRTEGNSASRTLDPSTPASPSASAAGATSAAGARPSSFWDSNPNSTAGAPKATGTTTDPFGKSAASAADTASSRPQEATRPLENTRPGGRTNGLDGDSNPLRNAASTPASSPALPTGSNPARPLAGDPMAAGSASPRSSTGAGFADAGFADTTSPAASAPAASAMPNRFNGIGGAGASTEPGSSRFVSPYDEPTPADASPSRFSDMGASRSVTNPASAATPTSPQLATPSAPVGNPYGMTGTAGTNSVASGIGTTMPVGTMPAASAAAGARTYVVQDGDTLYSIARYQLGKAEDWVAIYDLNQQSIGRQFDRLAPGTRLTLPEPMPTGGAMTIRGLGTNR